MRARRASRLNGHEGYAMVALLVGISIMAIALSVALPTWRTFAQREREAELIFRGEQYARAIALFQRQYANAFPPDIDTLVAQRFLRRKYLDPITGDAFQVLLVGQTPPGQAGAGNAPAAAPGQGRGGLATAPAGLSATPLGGRGGVMGVMSKSDATSLRVYNGRTKYSEWAFMATAVTTRAGAPTTSQNPTGGLPARGGQPGPGGRQNAPAGRGRGDGPGIGQPFAAPAPGPRQPGRF